MRPAAAIALFCVLASLSAADEGRGRNLKFENGHVFDGTRFVERPLYVTSFGYISRNPPAKIDQTIDLKGAYVVPAYGESHNHNVPGGRGTEEVMANYLRDGIFYVQNPNNILRLRSEMPESLNTWRGIDATFANAGLTATDGHPWGLVRTNMARKVFLPTDGEGQFVFTVDSLADLDKKWPAILAGKPDFIKVYLQYSEEFEKRRNDPAFVDWKALDPAIIPHVVRRAHKAGLRVAAHVETAADFRNAVRAGVDQILHMPGFRPPFNKPPYGPLDRYRITAVDAKEAGRRKVAVSTTVSEILGYVKNGLPGVDRADLDAIRDLIGANIRTLLTAGVPIALGSDRYRGNSSAEARMLSELKLMTPLEVLRAWSVVTPQTIFPKRKLGKLEGGWEANFIVLEGDPLADASNLFRIRQRVKSGRILP